MLIKFVLLTVEVEEVVADYRMDVDKAVMEAIDVA